MSTQDFTTPPASSKPAFQDSLGRPTRHGISLTPEYRTWIRIVHRCHNSEDISYSWYGGRGIRVCDRWRDDFLAFFEDVGPRPGPEYSIDRIDNDGHYEPGNVRWATRETQDNNRRNNRRLEYCGWSLTVAQWAGLLKVNRQMLLTRLQRGWTVEQVLTTPTGTIVLTGTQKGEKNGRAKLTPDQVKAIRAEYRSGVMGYRRLADRYGVSPRTVYRVVKCHHWPDA